VPLGPEVSGELHAMMLDMRRTFDEMVVEYSDPGRAQAILDNQFYQTVATSLAGTQEYMAMEKLGQLLAQDKWDLVVVDTPPSRHAIDLLEAPDRLVSFLSHPVYRALTVGQRAFARITDAAASMFLWAVRRLAGPQIVEDTVAFFRSLAHIESGLRRRASDVSKLLRGPSTSFVVVCSPRAEAIGEAEHLVGALRAGGFPLGSVVINLIHPLPDPLPADAATDVGGALADHFEWHAELRHLALAERAEIDGLVELAGDAVVVELPLLDVDIHDLAGLDHLADLLTDQPSRSR
jgi:anion-transporting  ArsA/GET3 family ATPase